jgi:hypothetical protein
MQPEADPAMKWVFQRARWGYYELVVSGLASPWKYELWWSTETARTNVGKGSDTYEDLYDARQAAILHLANILPKPESKRLLADQANLVWEPLFEPRSNRLSPRRR